LESFFNERSACRSRRREAAERDVQRNHALDVVQEVCALRAGETFRTVAKYFFAQLSVALPSGGRARAFAAHEAAVNRQRFGIEGGKNKPPEPLRLLLPERGVKLPNDLRRSDLLRNQKQADLFAGAAEGDFARVNRKRRGKEQRQRDGQHPPRRSRIRPPREQNLAGGEDDRRAVGADRLRPVGLRVVARLRSPLDRPSK
jgi:hypothetical protein